MSLLCLCTHNSSGVARRSLINFVINPLLLLLLLQVPTSCNNVPAASPHPEHQWANKAGFYSTLVKLGGMFLKNFERFHDGDAFVGECPTDAML